MCPSLKKKKSTKHKILIVDDDKNLAVTLADQLNARHRFDAYAVSSATEALDYLKTKSSEVSVVLTDIKMQGISGLELLSKIKVDYPHIKVVVMTGYHLPELQEEAYFRGSVKYIEKPFTIIQLEEIFENVPNADNKVDNRHGFVGKMVNLNLVDVIQMNCLARATNSITIESGDSKGVIYFENGEITHCRYNDIEGENAFYKIMHLRGGYLKINSEVSPSKKTVSLHYTTLLMKAMRKIDEHENSISKNHSLSNGNGAELYKSALTTNTEKEVTEMATSMSKLNQMFEELVAASPDIEGAAFAGTDGLVIASYIPAKSADPTRIGALIAAMQGMGKRTLDSLGQGSFKELSLSGAKGAVYIYKAGKSGILGVITKTEINVGMVNLLSRDMAKNLADMF